jgi:pectate lyase
MSLMRRISFALSLTAIAGCGLAHASERDLGRETLDPNNGFAALGAGVTGGSAAVPSQVYVVTNRRELIAALNNGVASATSPANASNEPKIIYVNGTIDANVDDNNNPLACADYNRNGYTMEAFLAAYDPTTYGRIPPAGAVEQARLASMAAQQARVRIRPGSNTTIVGMGKDATIRGAWFDIRGTANVPNSRTNIIIRNLTFQDSVDCFPQWAPTDGVLGSWNSLYDAISLRDANNIWIDHNVFEDRTSRDETLPLAFGVLFQVHDGLLDITNASDLVTVSWNRFRNHDKLMLIGSSDTAATDRGKLRVTLHHNSFDGVGQRGPRVRFGQIHLYNNLYDVRDTPKYQYSFGVGVESQIYAEKNVFLTTRDVTPDRFIKAFNGTSLTVLDTLVLGARVRNPVDLVAAYNAVNDPDLGNSTTFVPTLNFQLLPAVTTPILVPLFAGPLDW